MSQPKKIAIIGASYLQLPVVEKANELGIVTHCFAYLEGAVCKDHCSKFHPISILEKDEILEICRTLKIDGVLSIASDLAVVTVNYIAHHMGLIGNDLNSSESTTNKYKMKQVLVENDLPTAKFEIIRSEEDLERVSIFEYPLIVKPVDRSGSLGVSKINSSEELSLAFNQALKVSLCKEVIVEEFISGKEISVESISQNGSHRILAFTDKVTNGAPNFVELEHHQPAQ
ncbi:MAG: ATP-grasp domain-containing protein, partial [Crocinitomicaceae bacterium]|nr:ATP-grasp domain-containing protein [Crocinitomicaceae bacterium]